MSRNGIKAALRQSIAFKRVFRDLADSTVAALLLSQLWYWHDKGGSPDGWIFKTAKELEEETGLSRKEQQTARKHLVSAKLIKEELRGLPAKLFYWVDEDYILYLLDTQFDEKGLKLNSSQMGDVDILDVPIGTNLMGDVDILDGRCGQPILITENTYRDYEQRVRGAHEESQPSEKVLSPENQEKPGFQNFSDSEQTSLVIANIDREDNSSAAAAKTRAGDAKLGLGSMTTIDADYVRFKTVYERMVRVVGMHYGVRAKAEEQWEEAVRLGVIDSRFWEGLEIHINAVKGEFMATGKAIGIKSAANFLKDRDWEEALERQAMRDQAKASGVDITSPKSVKAAAKQAERDEVSRQARAIYEARNPNANA